MGGGAVVRVIRGKAPTGDRSGYGSGYGDGDGDGDGA